MTASASVDTRFDLIRDACRGGLHKLSKEGGITESWKDAGGVAVMTVILAAILVYIRIEVYNATDISTSLRGWARLAYWALIGLVPVTAVATAWFVARALRTAGAATLDVECPSCHARHELSAVHRKGFDFTCPGCFALISGAAGDHTARKACDYCGLEYFGRAEAKPGCPSCRRTAAGTSGRCQHCSQAIPKSAVFCIHCDQWLGEEEFGVSDLGPGTYDVTRFSAPAARTYVIVLAQRVSGFTAGVERILQAAGEKQPIDSGTILQILNGVSEMERLLPKLAVGAQWLSRPGGGTRKPMPPQAGDWLKRLEAALIRLRDRKVTVTKVDKVLPAVATARQNLPAA